MWTVVFVIAACGGAKSEKAAPAEPAPAAAPAATAEPAATSKSAAEDADQLNKQGKESMFGNQFADAELKFRSALALDPKPIYAFNLCVAEFSLGKLADAKTACKTAAASPEAPLAEKAT
jgi:hypothetical protein